MTVSNSRQSTLHLKTGYFRFKNIQCFYTLSSKSLLLANRERPYFRAGIRIAWKAVQPMPFIWLLLVDALKSYFNTREDDTEYITVLRLLQYFSCLDENIWLKTCWVSWKSPLWKNFRVVDFQPRKEKWQESQKKPQATVIIVDWLWFYWAVCSLLVLNCKPDLKPTLAENSMYICVRVIRYLTQIPVLWLICPNHQIS